MDIFSQCHTVNNLLNEGREQDARDQLIKMLEELREDGLEYSPLINHLIREVGLFPYMNPQTASWEDRFVFEAFKADIGEEKKVTLHREQSRLLNALLAGRSIAVSAPTSFGKSFVIDSFISIKRPKNVVIIVPTIALSDETRRRLQPKFSSTYKIITTSDQALADKNIFIFPQERALSCITALQDIDILIVDEFYKASKHFDKDRSPALIRAIIELSKVAKQRYFLAPNIRRLKENPFTKGMEFLHLDFNTVFLEKVDLYPEIKKNSEKKSSVLLNILERNKGKTLIYAGTFANISNLSNLLIVNSNVLERPLLKQFRAWLSEHYEPNWILPGLVERGIGIHNGRLHRSLSQIQIRLFEEKDGIDRLVSTSSIIEGVNTSAEVVVVWSNRNGRDRIKDYTYRNLIGRGGRMLRHFVGKIFILDEPPPAEETQLDLPFPDELLGAIDESEFLNELSPDQMDTIRQYKEEMSGFIGADGLEELRQSGLLQNSNTSLIRAIARELSQDSKSWKGLGYLNSENPDDWDYYIYKLINLQPGAWGIEYSKYVSFVKILSRNWISSIPELLVELYEHDITVDQFFELERNTSFRLASLLGDVSTIYNKIHIKAPVDLSVAISRLSHAFLPVPVFQLEEYGLPRMLSKKIHVSRVIDFELEHLTVHDVVENLRQLGIEGVKRSVGALDDFDIYILKYFFDGIENTKI